MEDVSFKARVLEKHIQDIFQAATKHMILANPPCVPEVWPVQRVAYDLRIQDEVQHYLNPQSR